MSVSNIPEKIKIILWGKAAGRCQYRGCNACLYRDTLTQAEFNTAYIAHIIADSPDGPRGDDELSEKLKADISNIMLMCDDHHRLIDKADIAGHSVSLLQEMKKEHEERIDRISAINTNMQSHIVIYKANVGVHTPEMSYESLREFLLPSHYSAMNRAIDLSLSNSPMRDQDEIFWSSELTNLETQFREQLLPLLRKGEIKHMSVFGFAPQPLLIKLGSLLNDIHFSEIHQPIINPKTWQWLDTANQINYKILEPSKHFPVVALNISLSAYINNDRITKILSDNCSIYNICIDKPFNDFMRCKKHLQNFSIEIRKLFNQIKSNYNAQTPLHIFPAMPVSSAICRMMARFARFSKKIAFMFSSLI